MPSVISLIAANISYSLNKEVPAFAPPMPTCISPATDSKTVLSRIYRGMPLHPGPKTRALSGQRTAYKFGSRKLSVSVGVGT